MYMKLNKVNKLTKKLMIYYINSNQSYLMFLLTEISRAHSSGYENSSKKIFDTIEEVQSSAYQSRFMSNLSELKFGITKGVYVQRTTKR